MDDSPFGPDGLAFRCSPDFLNRQIEICIVMRDFLDSNSDLYYYHKYLNRFK